MAEERWAALESNPDVLSKFCRKMGVGEQFEVVDVLGVDPDLLSFVPQPVLSLILLFPSRNSDGSRVREKLDVEKHELADKVFFLKQIEGHLDNACGTIAMIHAILNNKELLGLTDGSSPLEKFLEETSGMSYEERGRHLDNFRPVAEVHNSLVEEGQSRVQSSDNVLLKTEHCCPKGLSPFRVRDGCGGSHGRAGRSLQLGTQRHQEVERGRVSSQLCRRVYQREIFCQRPQQHHVLPHGPRHAVAQPHIIIIKILFCMNLVNFGSCQGSGEIICDLSY
jgi:hypothetical protein